MQFWGFKNGADTVKVLLLLFNSRTHFHSYSKVKTLPSK